MPRKRESAKVEHRVLSKKIWILYSTNRQYCFLEEIREGFFGPNYRCGCTACAPVLALAEPRFTQPPGQVRAGQPET